MAAWLGVAWAARAAAVVLLAAIRLAARTTGEAAGAGHRAARRLAHRTRTTLLPAARRGAADLRAWWRRRGQPGLLFALLLTATAAQAMARHGAALADRAALLAGVAWHRAHARGLDALDVLLTVRAPEGWAWLRPRAITTGRAAARATARASRRASRTLRRHLPLLLRRTAIGLGVVSAVTVVSWAGVETALAVAARTIDVGTLPPLAQPSTVVAADGATLARLHDGIRRQPVTLEDVPPHVRQAVLAAEDARFPEHRGFDLAAIGRAALANLRAGGAVQGGSTITQQLAKQTFVGDERVLSRKVREVLHAVALERQLGKDAILERYLNHVYLGAGAYGVAEAAQEYFGADVGDLTPAQGALLASLIRAPGSFDPRGDPASAERRRDHVLRRMGTLGMVGAATLEAALAEPVALEPRRPDPVHEPFIVAAARRELLADPRLGATAEERADRLATGGLRIEVSVDPGLQDVARRIVEERLAGGELSAALATVEAGTGRVLALHGGADYAASQFDLAAQARRQPGSLLKPLLAVAALEAGWDPAATFDGGARRTYELEGERWTVGNFAGIDHGEVDLHGALVHSVNTAFADLVEVVGHDAVVDVTASLGVDPERAFGPAASHGPSIALGGLTHGLSPLEVAGAYATFLDGGRFARPHLVDRVVDADGRELVGPASAAEPVLDEAATVQVAAALEDAVRSGTGRRAAIEGRVVLGKTGTTQDGADAWFAGGTGGLSTAVWVGRADSRARVPGSTGGAVAAPLWRDFTVRALEALDR
jgi:membrane peptidoglycan carboxypeptidase